jgi:hypothetical protein
VITVEQQLLTALKKLVSAVRTNHPGGYVKTADQIFDEAGHEALAAIDRAELRLVKADEA